MSHWLRAFAYSPIISILAGSSLALLLGKKVAGFDLRRDYGLIYLPWVLLIGASGGILGYSGSRMALRCMTKK